MSLPLYAKVVRLKLVTECNSTFPIEKRNILKIGDNIKQMQ